MRKRLIAIVSAIVLCTGLFAVSLKYSRFVSDMIYEESAAI